MSQQSHQQQEIYISRFIIDNKKLYLRSLWAEDHFSLYVTDGRYLWLGEASASFIESNMLIRGLEMENFIKRSKGALITQDVTQGEKLTDLEFTWFFRLGQTDIMARCMLPLGRVSDGQQAQKCMQQILDFFVDRRNYLERQNNDLSDLNKSLKTQRDDALGQFSKLVEDKKVLESELYKKFILVLNEKKQKIRELKDALEHAQNARIERSKQLEEEEEEEDNKSEESDISPYTKRKRKHSKKDKERQNDNGNENSPLSRAISSMSFNLNEKVTPSLDLLDSSDIVVTTTVRRRHRPNDKSQPNGNSNSTTTNSSSSNNNNSISNNNSNNNNNNNNKHIFATPTKKPRPLLAEHGSKQTSPFTPGNRKRRRAIDNETTDANDLLDDL